MDSTYSTCMCRTCPFIAKLINQFPQDDATTELELELELAACAATAALLACADKDDDDDEDEDDEEEEEAVCTQASI